LIEHYHCHKFFCQKTCSKQIPNTVFFKHHYITQPKATPEDQIVKAIGDLTSALHTWINIKGNSNMEVLTKMNNILKTPSKLWHHKRKLPSKTPYQNQGWGEVEVACNNH
jgi:hypothetical protein